MCMCMYPSPDVHQLADILVLGVSNQEHYAMESPLAPITVSLLNRNNHFDMLTNVTGADFVGSQFFLEERRLHEYRRNVCRHDSEMQEAESIVGSGSCSEIAIEENWCGSAYSSSVYDGTSSANNSSKSLFDCGAPCLDMDCRDVKESGQLDSLKALTGQLTRQEKKDKIRTELAHAMRWDAKDSSWKYVFRVNFRSVCIGVWASANGFSSKTVYRIKRVFEERAQQLVDAGDIDVPSRILDEAPRKSREVSIKVCMAVAWLKQYGQEIGDKMPFNDGALRGSGVGSVDDGKSSDSDDNSDQAHIRLPYSLKSDVYVAYLQGAALRGEDTISKGHFLRLWQQRFPHMKVAKLKGTFPMCSVCAALTGNIKAASTAHASARLVRHREEHLVLQRDQRLQYYSNRLFAIENPDEALSLIIDGMDQGKTYLPLMTRRQKNDRLKMMKQKIMGVLVHGHGKYLYVGHLPLKLGANFTLECLWRTFNKLGDELRLLGRHLPKKICIQMDNASDNKAMAVLAFAAYMIEEGLAEEISLNFLLVGHTHEDIDQMFSVISRRFSRLVFNESSRAVISFEDFVDEVMLSFAQGNKPKCVERVAAIHDFSGWLAPFRDPGIHGINKFRHFNFRAQRADEFDALEDGWKEKARGKAIMRCKKYMSDPDRKYKPGAEDLIQYGPVVVLAGGRVEGMPNYEGFRDLTVPTMGKEGVVNPLPREYNGKSSAEILDLQKRQWLRWVEDPQHGANALQRMQFRSLMNDIASAVEDLPASVPLLPWRNVTPILLRGGALPEEEGQQVIPSSPEAPSPRISYGALSHNVASAAMREFDRVQRVDVELAASRGECAKMKRGDILLVKNHVSTGNGRDELQWWLGISLATHEEQPRSECVDTLIAVQWMYPSLNGTDGVPINDLNAKFVPWFHRRVGNGPKNRANVENVAREAVVMIGISLTKSHTITVKCKKEIGDLRIGYTFCKSTKSLQYDIGMRVGV